MAMPEKMQRTPVANFFISIVRIKEPVRWMMTDRDVHDIFDWIENRL
jgi:mannitol/fructose-specific phosphotransferase system IIA component (Ntr-type)